MMSLSGTFMMSPFWGRVRDGDNNKFKDNVDNKQEGLIMSIPQLAWVWRNVAKKDKKLQDEAVCYYKTFIGYCKMNDIELSRGGVVPVRFTLYRYSPSSLQKNETLVV